VAAFDFDGTLSTRDNLVPCLCRVAGRASVLRALAAGSASVTSRGRASWSRNELKAEVVRRLLTGFDASRLDALGRAFAFEILRRRLRGDAVERVDWHRTQGHRLVVVSASFGAYVRPVAEQLRFDAVLATELEVGEDGRLTGRLVGGNVRGAEKARRLEAWLDNTPAYVWAYGDSGGDRELLERADHAVRLTKRYPFARPHLSTQ